MNYYVQREDELQHFGILGQKWGIRRFQNPDGSYTEAGKERYYDRKGYLTKEGTQKYAVRRTIDDLQAKTIPAGTKFYRISKPGAGTPTGSMYVFPQQDLANIRSITPALANWSNTQPYKMKESSFVTTEELKIPSQKEANEVMLSVLDSDNLMKRVSLFSFSEYASGTGMMKLRMDKKSLNDLDNSNDEEFVKTATQSYKSSIESIYKMLGINPSDDVYQAKITSDAKDNAEFLLKGRNAFLNKLETVKDTKISDIDKIPENVKEEVNWFLANSVAALDDYREKTIAELSKRGYNAMYDNNMISAGTINKQEAYEPLLVFNSSSLEKTKESKISSVDLFKSEMKYQDYRNKVDEDARSKGLTHSDI